MPYARQNLMGSTIALKISKIKLAISIIAARGMVNLKKATGYQR
jgi:hypothetical protein